VYQALEVNSNLVNVLDLVVLLLTFFSTTATGVITVRVGQGTQQEDFSVHESIVSPRSKFFETAITNARIEGTAKIVDLPVQKPQAFRKYVDYLYTTMLPTGIHNVTTDFIQLGSLCVLAEKLAGVGLKDFILWTMVTLAQKHYLKPLF